MFILDAPEVPYRDPWFAPFDARFAQLLRCQTRVAYFYERPDNSTFRYRIYNVVQSLASSSRVSASWFTLDDMDKMDRVLDVAHILVFCRTRYDDKISGLITRARSRGLQVLFDIDDYVFEPSMIHLVFETLDRPGSWDEWFAYSSRLAEVLRACDGAITTNEVLARRLIEFSGKPAKVIPNFMNREQLEISARLYEQKVSMAFGRDGRIHLGYFSGSPSHNRDFDIISGALATLLDEDERIVVRVVGFLEPRGPITRHKERVEILPFVDFVNLQRLVAEVEVNLMPLQQNSFTDCKSELKYFEAAAVGTVSIASPTASYARVITDARNGFLARSYEWQKKIRQFIDQLDTYAAFVAPVHDDVLREYTGQTELIESVFLDKFGPEPNARSLSSPTIRDRATALKSLFDPTGFGLEIGPSHNPLLPKSSGARVEIADYTTADRLREKYRSAVGTDVDRIEEVDHVLDGRRLGEAIPRSDIYDFIVASHVIEHLPDPLGFLKDCERLLKPEGVLVLAVPDKRFCFDVFQPLTSTGAIVQSHLDRRMRPPPGALLDDLAYSATRDGAIGWSVGNVAPLSFVYDVEQVQRHYARLRDSTEYHDVHLWRFVPSSFRLIIADLSGLGEIGLREKVFYPQDGEFFISLARNGPGCPLDRLTLAKCALREHAQIAIQEPVDLTASPSALGERNPHSRIR